MTLCYPYQGHCSISQECSYASQGPTLQNASLGSVKTAILMDMITIDGYPWDLGVPVVSDHKMTHDSLFVSNISYVLVHIWDVGAPKNHFYIFWDGLKRLDDDASISSMEGATAAPRNTCCPDGSTCPSAASSQLDGCSKKKTSCVSQELVTWFNMAIWESMESWVFGGLLKIDKIDGIPV